MTDTQSDGRNEKQVERDAKSPREGEKIERGEDKRRANKQEVVLASWKGGYSSV